MPKMAFFYWTRLNLLNLGLSFFVAFHILLCGHKVKAEIVVKDLDSNETAAIFPDMQAGFGDDFPKHGMKGRVVIAEPKTACSPIKKAPKNIDGYVWIVLIERGGCPFTEKAIRAELSGYEAVIIYNYPGNNNVIQMRGHGADIDIPSTFVGFNSGMDLATQYSYPRFKEYVITIKEVEEVDYRMYLLPFAIVVGVCFFMIMLFLIIKFIRDHTRTRVARLSKKHLKKIPIRKFKKGQYYDTCAICLDEYEDGEKIRVLPCEHAYHAKCIDPWLTRNKKTCPVCKRRVIPGKDPNSESDTDSEEGGGASQTTPLLMGATTQRTHGSMNQVEGDSGPTPRASSAPPLFEATVVLEAEGAVGGIGINHMSDGGSSSTSYGGSRLRTELDMERGEQREGRRRRRERKEEEDRLLLGTEEDEEEEERRKAERKERRKKKKEKKKKSKRGGSSSADIGDSGSGRADREGESFVRADLETVEEAVGVDNVDDDGVVEDAGSSGLSRNGVLGPGPIVVDEDEDFVGSSSGIHRHSSGGQVNSGYSDNQEVAQQEVVVSQTRRGKKREMSEVV